MANALSIKKWCDENISPVAWQRVVMKNLDLFRTKSLGLADLETPANTINLENELVEAVKKTIQELYKMELPVAVLA
ncbi:hypothetical protein AD998_18345 [bacterium 336/3]|nr:hypothetical protein AD998_18345 [bacterium 336/3]